MPFPIRLADVMSSPVHTTGPDATAAQAAATCTEEDVGSLVVVEAVGGLLPVVGVGAVATLVIVVVLVRWYRRGDEEI